MRTITLPPGTFTIEEILGTPEIRVPVELIAEQPWLTTIWPERPGLHTINADALVMISGCEIVGVAGGYTGSGDAVKGQTGAPVILTNCWIHGGLRAVLGRNLVLAGCLVQGAGLNRRHDHGVYAYGRLYAQGCIFDGGADSAVHIWVKKGPVQAELDRCLIVAGPKQAIHSASEDRLKIALTNSTIVGPVEPPEIIPAIDKGNNLFLPREALTNGHPTIVNGRKGLFWLALPGQCGCYDYDVALTQKRADALWKDGEMMPVNGCWLGPNGEPGRWPHFPGDPVPIVGNVG